MSDIPLESGRPGSVPNPDPTERTREDLLRAMAAERQITDGELSIRDERLRGIDEATRLRLEFIDGIDEKVDEKVGHLSSIMETKFDAIAQQFRERDTRSERESRDNKVAVDAAFAAQKEAASEQNKSNSLAISKSEAATAEALVKLSQLVDVAVNALRDTQDDLKERIGLVDRDLRAIAASGSGQATGTELAQIAAERTRTIIFGVIAAVGVLVGVIGFVLFLTQGDPAVVN